MPLCALPFPVRHHITLLVPLSLPRPSPASPFAPMQGQGTRSEAAAPAAAALPRSTSAANKAPARPCVSDCKIVGTQTIDDAVHYLVQVTTAAGDSWCTLKRYSQFEEFHYMLLDCVNEHSLPAGAELPGKRLKLWYAHNSKTFVEERALLLENYLKKLIQVPAIAASDLLVGFLAVSRVDVKPPPRATPKEALAAAELPDDVEVTGVSLPQVRLMSDHVLYQVDVVNVRKRRSFQRWTVLKRFAQFIELDEALREAFAHRPDVLDALPLTPEKYSKLLYNHLDDHFVEQRRVVLENYLQKLMLVTPVLYNQQFLTFLGCWSSSN